MSLDVQTLIFAQIVKVLNRAGFWGARQIAKKPSLKDARHHGFDESKFNGASLFYLPCQAKAPEDSFFLDYGAGDPKRGPLDARAWIEHCILDLRPEPEPEKPAPKPSPTKLSANVAEKRRVSASLQAVLDTLAEQQAQSGAGRRAEQIEKAVQEWRAASRGEGHGAFFRLGAALHRAGLAEHEIADKMHEEASYAYSSRERRTEIKGIIKSLRRSGTLTGSRRRF